MTIEECYRKLGGDYVELKSRLISEQLIERFMLRFPNDVTFQALCEAIGKGNREEAFRAAHTLKGLCQNLGFGALSASVVKMTEILRPVVPQIPQEAIALLPEVRRDYENAVATILAYADGQQNK